MFSEKLSQVHVFLIVLTFVLNILFFFFQDVLIYFIDSVLIDYFEVLFLEDRMTEEEHKLLYDERDKFYQQMRDINKVSNIVEKYDILLKKLGM